MESSDHVRAGEVFRADLIKNPNDGWSVYGVAMVADAGNNALQRMMMSKHLAAVLEFFTFELETPSYL